MVTLSLDNPVVGSYILYSTVLALKILLMAVLTARLRIQKAIFANPEDAATAQGRGKVRFDDIDIERVRRAHLNDLENIPIFFVLGFFYILTDPAVWLATLLFRILAAARFIHTLVYAVVVIPQPARAIAHLVSYFIMWYMGVSVLIKFIGYF